MVTTSLLIASAVIVGIFVGAVGVGGVLLIPSLMTFAGLSIHEAAATALFTFLFTGILGSSLYGRRGSLQWRIAIPVCAGALLLSFVGALVGSLIAGRALTWVVAAILAGAGLYIVWPTNHSASRIEGRRKPAKLATLLGVGALSGFGAGVSGAGGPLFSVPLMLGLHFDPLIAVGIGQIVQVAASLSGSLGNLGTGNIRYGVALPVTLAELTGVIVGVRIAHAAQAAQLKYAAALLCVASAIGLLVKSFAG